MRGQVEQTYQIIVDTATPVTSYVGSCGGDYVTGPNNDWGYGTIDALAAVQQAIAMGGAGSLDGNVSDAVSGGDVVDANVLAEHSDGFSWAFQTDPTGYYTGTVATGIYTLTVTHPHYTDGVVTGVEVVTDTVTTVDIALEPRGRLFGYVTDYDNGFPLEGATLTAHDGTTAVSGADGSYERYLDEGTYTVTATLEDYGSDSASVSVTSGGDTQQDFALMANVS